MGRDREEVIKGECVERSTIYDENDRIVEIKRKPKRRTPKGKMLRPGLGGQLGPHKKH